MNVSDAVGVEEDGWNCALCTFLNHPALNICECCLFERQSDFSEQLVYYTSPYCNVRNVLSHPTTSLPVIVAIQLASQWASYVDARGGARRMVLREQ